MRNAIILKDNALLHLLKSPADGADRADAAELIHVGLEELDLAGPVDLMLDHRTGACHLQGFTEALGIGAVAGHE